MSVFGGIFAAGSVAKKLIETAAEEVEALIHIGGREVRATVDHTATAAGRVIYQFEQSANNVVRFAINETGDAVRVLSGELEQRARVTLRHAGEEVRYCIDKSVGGAQQLLGMDVPRAARLSGAQAVLGIAEGARMAVGRTPLQSLSSAVYQELLSKDSTPMRVVQLINRQGPATSPKEIHDAYKLAFDVYAQCQLGTEYVFLCQLWFFAEARARIGNLQTSWRPWGVNRDGWQAFRDGLVQYPDGNLRERALLCLDNPSPRSETTMSELAEIFHEVQQRAARQHAPSLPQPEQQEVSAELKQRLIDSIVHNRVEEASNAVREMQEIQEASVALAIREDGTISLHQILDFHRACSGSEEGNRVLISFAERVQPDGQSCEDVMEFAKRWGNACSVPLPVDIISAATTRCQQVLSAKRFQDLAELLLVYSKVRGPNLRPILRSLTVGDHQLSENREVFQLVYCLRQQHAERVILESFHPTVVALLDGSRQFCIANQDYVLEGKGCPWGRGPGWFVQSKICRVDERTGSKLWRATVHESGAWFSFTTVEARVLEGGRKDWDGGPSYYATTHPNEHGGTSPNMLWRITPKANGRFNLHCQCGNQQLNAEGRYLTGVFRMWSGLRATTEATNRGEEHHKEFDFIAV